MIDFSSIAIFSDYDNTLTCKSKIFLDEPIPRVHPRNVEAIKRFTEKGGIFGMASGRNYDDLERLRKHIPISDLCVCTNGSVYSFSKKEFLLSYTLSRDEFVEDAKKIFSYEKLRRWRITDRNSQNFEWVKGESEEDAFSFYSRQAFPFYKFAFYEKDLDLAFALYDFLVENFADRYTVERSALSFLELYKKGGGKGSVIQKLKTFLPSVKTIICIGDHENDITMLKNADIGVCVGDGNEQVKKVAKYVVAPSDEGSIADLIEKIERGEIV